MNIKLFGGEVCVIDAADYHLIRGLSWCASYTYKNGVKGALGGVAGSCDDGRVMMGRLIINAPAGMFVDYIDGNVLNNRRENLRLATRAESLRNRKIHSSNKCGIKGVYFDARRNKWRGQVKFNNKKYTVNGFDTKEAAHAARAELAKQLHGDFYRGD